MKKDSAKRRRHHAVRARKQSRRVTRNKGTQRARLNQAFNESRREEKKQVEEGFFRRVFGLGLRDDT